MRNGGPDDVREKTFEGEAGGQIVHLLGEYLGERHSAIGAMRSIPRVGECVLLDDLAWRVSTVLYQPAAARGPRIRVYLQHAPDDDSTW